MMGRTHRAIYFSLWRVACMEMFIISLAILPLVPGFHHGLRYTAFYYKPVFYPILIISSSIFVYMFCAGIPLLWRAVRGLPAVEFVGDYLLLHGIRSRSIVKSDIIKTNGPSFGNLTIFVEGERNAILPIYLYKNRKDELEWIKTWIEK